MPCLNEEETLEACISKAWKGFREAGVTGEVLVADNGSTDGSIAIAERLGARVVRVAEKGYGCALRGGIEAASAPWVLMGDSDDSYDFSNIRGFVSKLREGYDLVMGCRLPSGGGTILPGAMPWKNRWIGNPALSFLGRIFFHPPIHDFHCGLRAFTKESYARMNLQTTGMEFASEMVMKANLWNMRLTEVPITLHPDGRSRPPHLKPWRDGWRHLRFMLIYSPRWLFLIPGLLLLGIGSALTALLSFGRLGVGGVHFATGTMMMGAMGIIIGLQLVGFAVSTKVFAIGERLVPERAEFSALFRVFNLERGLLAGFVSLFAGGAVILHDFLFWRDAHFGDLPHDENMRHLILGTTALIVGIQIISTSFFLSVLGLKTRSRKPPAC
jgi:cellulose synthase/poly-beta-1,6-N-acetylglucosamine synthase-like glycosyltransferase